MKGENVEKLGNQLIELLSLKVKSNGRVDTSEGDKTPIGLALTIMRKVDESDYKTQTLEDIAKNMKKE